MKHALTAVLAIVLLAALAMPALAQNTPSTAGTPGQSSATGSTPGAGSPGQSSASSTTSSSDQSRVGADSVTDRDQSSNKTASSAETSGHGNENAGMQNAGDRSAQLARMLTGGEEADKVQFQALDQHLQMIERAMNQLRQFASQPSSNAADIMRWSDIRDQHAQEFADIVASYFLQQRIVPPTMSEFGMASTRDQAREQAGIAGAQNQNREGSATATTASASENDPMHRAYIDQLQTAHELLVRAHMIKQSSDPQDVQQLRSLVNQLRTNQQGYQRQIEAHVREMQSRGGAGTEQAARTGQQNMEPGIDQPSERQAARPEQNTPGSSTTTPNTTSPSTPGSPSTTPGSPSTTPGSPSTTPGGSSGSTTP